MVAQRLDKPGANSFLQLHADGFLADPHAYALLQVFRDNRDLGLSPWHSQILVDLVHGGLQLPTGSVTQKSYCEASISFSGKFGVMAQSMTPMVRSTWLPSIGASCV